jgi:predicted MPP superfamily phosphohydrolase
VRRAEVPIAGLPAGLDGLQIVQLSDIHIGDFMPREEVRRAVNIANSLGAHLAVVTGDLITGESDPLEACVEELQRLRAPLGVFGCNGNHEIYAEAEDVVERLFLQHGMRLLRQERAELEWQGGRLNLIGVDYQRDRMVRGPKRPMLEDVDSLVRRDMPNVLLSHNPNSFYQAAKLGIELTLAGHTHGGQVQVEIVDKRWNPARFITPFIAGLYHLPLGSGGASSSTAATASGQASLYVNAGLGTIGVPARLAVDPEITLLTLRRA